jgi:site-specific DNA recombinase
MPRAAIYARYSTDDQRATSIEDQIRRAREKAQKLGFDVPDELIFFDAAVTGRSSGLSKRKGFARLLAAWDSNKFEALFIDEVSRISRDLLELTSVRERAEKSGVRLVSGDGVDSTLQGWQFFYDVLSVLASNAVRETAHQVTRGMVGQLERGFMIAAPPYGYRRVRDENDLGTKWTMDEKESELVCNIFRRRHDGVSLAKIALSLNELGIPSPRPSRICGAPRYWRPATVRQMLANTIYRGLFVWNGSPVSRAKAERGNKRLETIDYMRPDLRLVEDHIWFECNRPASQRKIRGGKIHVFSRLLTCGSCNATLTVATGGSAPALYCAQCSQAKEVGMPDRKGRYVSANGVKAVLVYAMEKLLSNLSLEVFRDRLRERLLEGGEVRIDELKQEIIRKERASIRLIQLIASAETEDPLVRQKYDKVTAQKIQLALKMKELEQELSHRDMREIEHALAVNPIHLLPDLFEDGVSVEKLRAVLQRLFTEIAVLDKPSRFSTEFRIVVAPEISIADHAVSQVKTESEVKNESNLTLMLRLTTSAKRPTTWTVTEC